jgi:peroxiredoxin/mono/diheme cytochrome c family protein
MQLSPCSLSREIPSPQGTCGTARRIQALVFVGFLITAFLFQPSAFAAEPLAGRIITPFTLRDARGKETSLADFKEHDVLVVAFLGTECPLAKLYGPKLAKLEKEYRSRGVGFVAINSNAQDSLAEMAAYAKSCEMEFAQLKDPDQKVADLFGATRTPEIFVLDARRAVRYHGPVDDQFGVGVARDKPTQDYLKTAIDELRSGNPLSCIEREPVGCKIGREPREKTATGVTYSKEIARILQARCVECHRAGEIGPFALTRYEEAAPWAETIAEAVRESRMPPWHADPKHGKFANDQRLATAEREAIVAWAAAGAPEGKKSEAPPPRTFVEGWQLPRKPDVVVPMRKTAFPVAAEGTIDYQYFTVEPGFKEDKWVSAAEIVPGNRAVVHHVLVFVKTKGSRFGKGEGYLACYVPGARVQPFPQGMAKRIPAGAKLSFQVHYTPVGTPQEDVTSIGLVFAKPEEVTHAVLTGSASIKRLAIPPHAENHRAEATSASAGVEILLLSMTPHMHLRGKSFTYEQLTSRGGRETLLSVPRYDFNWQTSYTLAEPKVLSAGTKIRCTAHYDNSAKNHANPDPSASVKWGPKTSDEMLFGYFDFAVEKKHLAAAEKLGQ